MRTAHSMEKDMMLGPDKWRKAAHKMNRRNTRNPDDDLV